MKRGVALAFLGLAAFAVTPAQSAPFIQNLGNGVWTPSGALAVYGIETFDTRPAVTVPNESSIATQWNNAAGPVTATFNAGQPVDSQGLVVPYPGASNTYAAPANGPGGNFFSVQGPAVGSQASVTFSAGINSIGLYWGSIDTYNSIAFYNGNTLLETVLGSALPPANGNQSAAGTNTYITVSLDSLFNRVVFMSSQRAFEMDNVAWGDLRQDQAPVPLPGALAMLCGGLGVVGLLARRRRRTA